MQEDGKELRDLYRFRRVICSIVLRLVIGSALTDEPTIASMTAALAPSPNRAGRWRAGAHVAALVDEESRGSAVTG